MVKTKLLRDRNFTHIPNGQSSTFNPIMVSSLLVFQVSFTQPGNCATVSVYLNSAISPAFQREMKDTH